MMRRKIELCFLLMLAVVSLSSQVITRDEAKDNIPLLSSSLMAYQQPTTNLTPAPKGYKPFYMSHYGRHGSRFLTSASQYDRPREILSKAVEDGALTEFGLAVYKRIEVMCQVAEGRVGDLTQVGKEEHKGIAYRMVRNYPTLFSGRSVINTLSTTTPRTILSMASACMEFSRLSPGITIIFDASGRDSYYMGNIDEAVNSFRNSREKSLAVSEFNVRHTHPERLMIAMFKDTTYITRFDTEVSSFGRFMMPGARQQTDDTPPTYVKQDMSVTLFSQISEIAANMRSHDIGFNLDDVLTPDEWYDFFLMNNLYWYSMSAFTPLSGDIVPYGQVNLLKNIIFTAQEVIDNGGVSATLRFGHDTYMFPLLCLMEINDCAWSVDDFERVADKWVSYDICYMGSNLQLVFYKNRQGNVLVKALLNEKEAKLPIESELAPYYDWEDLLKYYSSKIEFFENKKEELSVVNQ